MRQVPKNGYQTATTIQTNLPSLEWKQKVESKTDQSKYTKNELVQPIRIENSVNKHSDATWNIYSHHINSWHGVKQTISNEYVYAKTLYTLSQ